MCLFAEVTRMRYFLSLAFAAVLSLTPAFAMPDDDNYPPMSDQFLDRIISGKAGGAFLSEDFASIDAITSLYLKTQARTPAGVWKLALVYDGFDFPAADEHTYALNEKIAEKWLAQFPKSTTARIAYAKILIDHAFFFRGEGLVSQVAPSAWPKFGSYVARARTVLESCKNFCTADPGWYATMLDIANLQDWDKKSFTALFNEATAKFPGYTRLYAQGARYFSPLWHGSVNELDTFVQDAIDKTRSTEGTILYARVYGYIMHTSGYRCGCWRLQWWRMYNALVELNNKYPDPMNENEFAWQACMNGDRIAFKTAMSKIPKGPPDWSIWGSPEILQICQKWAVDKFSPPGSPFDQPHHPVSKGTTTL